MASHGSPDGGRSRTPITFRNPGCESMHRTVADAALEGEGDA